jgi:hypothetical protein
MARSSFAPVLLAVLSLVLPATVSTASSTTYTTDPSYLVNVGGLADNDNGNNATVGVGGHVRGQIVAGLLMGQPVKTYAFAVHDHTACDTNEMPASHQGVLRLTGIANNSTFGTTVWTQARFYLGGNPDELGPKDPADPVQRTVYLNVTTDYEITNWTCPHRPTTNVFKFHVGIWQGNQNGWTSRAKTPAL